MEITVYTISTLEYSVISDKIPQKLDIPHIILTIKYFSNFELKEIKFEYITQNITQNKISHEFSNIDLISNSLNFPGETLYEKILDMYKKIIINNPQFSSSLEGIPGDKSFNKFFNYFISNIGLLLTIFYFVDYINQNPNMKWNFLFPLDICFPNINLQINIFNKYLYGYIKFFYQNDTIPTLTKGWFKQLHEFWEIFGDYLTNVENDTAEMIYCLHIANLGFANYFKWLSSINFKEQLIANEKIEITIKNKSKEINKYYDEQLLNIAERIGEYSNIIESITDECSRKIDVKIQEFNLSIDSNKNKLIEDFNNKIENVIKNENTKSINKMNEISKKNVDEINSIIISIGDKYNSKFNTLFNDILDKKHGIISEINKIKQEIFSHSNDTKNILYDNIKSISDEILDLVENEQTKLQKAQQKVITENNLLIDNLLNIKEDVYNSSEKIENEIIDSIKLKLKDIISDIFLELSDNIDVIIENKIDIAINDKIKQISIEFEENIDDEIL